MNETIITTGNGTWEVKANESGVIETKQISAQGSQAPEKTRNDKIHDAVATRVEKFVQDTVRILAGVGISDMHGNFERLFPIVFHTMVDKYTQEVTG